VGEGRYAFNTEDGAEVPADQISPAGKSEGFSKFLGEEGTLRKGAKCHIVGEDVRAHGHGCFTFNFGPTAMGGRWKS